MEIKTYCEPGKSLQQRGGSRPEGWVEMKEERPGEDFVATYNGTWVKPIKVPESVSAAQGGTALIKLGKMNSVLSVVNHQDTPSEYKWAWDRATTWERNSPTLLYISQKAGISDKEMDDLFIEASKIIP